MSTLTPNIQFRFDQVDTRLGAPDFWSWAFSNARDPFLRGVLIEYLLCQHLISHAEEIAGKLVEHFTFQNPYPDNLSKSLRKSFEFQHQGDVFDLQLTWGLTIEIKSTASPKHWRINKTSYWNLLLDKNLKRKGFQAHYYVLAELTQSPRTDQGALTFENIRFHLLSRDDLEALAGTKNHVTFDQFSSLSLAQKQTCDYQQLPFRLKALVNRRFALSLNQIERGWKIPLPRVRGAFPLAVEKDGVIHAGYYCGTSKKPLNRFDVPWRKGFTPTWKDWESVGLRFVPER
ncbi:hypothetical protein D3X12_24560 [Pseudomonas protegens]|nr:hypothetical protein [Pseudomonas protegens]ASE22713.1 hypothetical protein CEP86_20380 [Pseudomonas protegens]QEZ53601.1 hypothetical protein D3X12_24560 [Pseudomonas protegens]QEZ60194.1 hypothetical protein D4N38_27265 [Pseudomonas protegens]QEZ64887.1 hypothetical protein D4N37_19885 [Pseudomonas protegens]QIC31229.1 hypothetical protein FQ342_23220 [Pseudomonas protegens]